MKKIISLVLTFLVYFSFATNVFADDFNIKPDSFSGLTDLPYVYSGYTFNKRVIFYNQENGWYAKDYDDTLVYATQCGGQVGLCVTASNDTSPLAFVHSTNSRIRQFEWNDSTHQWVFDTYTTSEGFKLNINCSIEDVILYSSEDVRYYSRIANPNYTNAIYYGGVNLDNNEVVFAGDIPIELAISVTPSEGGSVTGDYGLNGSFECNVNQSELCQYSIGYGIQVTLTANPNNGWTFDHWDDGLLHTNNPLVMTMNGSKNVFAVFTQNIYNISVNMDTTKGLAFSDEQPNPFIHCDDQIGSLCDNNYTWHESVTLKAESKPGYAFVRWEENGFSVSTERSYCFLVEWPRVLVPVFEEFRLRFPLEGRVPYITEGQTAVRVTSVMDHSLSGGYYSYDGRNHEVVAYNGLIANGTEYNYDGVYCYDVANLNPFPGLNYSAAQHENYKEICYDEHPGYDFGGLAPQNYDPNQVDPYDGQLGNGHNILATQSGKLYKDDTGVIYNTGWNSYHAFYINHGNDYYSWYLHAGRLMADIENQIQAQGYADVVLGQHIAEASGYGPSGQNTYDDHLHFEVRKDGYSNVIDPYGENLWEQPAP